MVLAQFDGTNGYWPSAAETYFAVDPAPQETPPPEAQPDMTGTYVLYAAIAIIVAMIIIGAAIVLILKRR